MAGKLKRIFFLGGGVGLVRVGVNEEAKFFVKIQIKKIVGGSVQGSGGRGAVWVGGQGGGEWGGGGGGGEWSGWGGGWGVRVDEGRIEVFVKIQKQKN